MSTNAVLEGYTKFPFSFGSSFSSPETALNLQHESSISKFTDTSWQPRASQIWRDSDSFMTCCGSKSTDTCVIVCWTLYPAFPSTVGWHKVEKGSFLAYDFADSVFGDSCSSTFSALPESGFSKAVGTSITEWTSVFSERSVFISKVVWEDNSPFGMSKLESLSSECRRMSRIEFTLLNTTSLRIWYSGFVRTSLKDMNETY